MMDTCRRRLYLSYADLVFGLQNSPGGSCSAKRQICAHQLCIMQLCIMLCCGFVLVGSISKCSATALIQCWTKWACGQIQQGTFYVLNFLSVATLTILIYRRLRLPCGLPTFLFFSNEIYQNIALWHSSQPPENRVKSSSLTNNQILFPSYITHTT